MQKVSKAYKESMKSSLRERAYIMLSFGLVNQEAQAKARIDESGDFAYFSNSATVFSDKANFPVYATLEENFTKVDGSMFFLPRRNASDSYYDTGLVSGSKCILDAIACTCASLPSARKTEVGPSALRTMATTPTDIDMRP